MDTPNSRATEGQMSECQNCERDAGLDWDDPEARLCRACQQDEQEARQ
jgi:hypothetical protein